MPRPLTRIATPLEYFDRLQLANDLFGDDIQLLGVLDAGAEEENKGEENKEERRGKE